MKTIFEDLKVIANEIENLIKTGELGYSNSSNATGDNQLKLDVASDKIIEKIFAKNPNIKAIVSEEKEEILNLNTSGKYFICYDPLDGSSIVDVNLSVGSIFGIYEEKLTGKNLIGAAYIVFGPRVEIVTVFDEGRPKLFRKNKSGNFEFVQEIFLEKKGKINAPGGTQKNWLKKHKEFVESLFLEGYRLRYSGGMVPDLHQILLKKGGIFSYPATSDKPKGKLRALFEVFPFAKIYEAAGGEAVDEKGKRLLEREIEHYHDTTPCFFGSEYEIRRLKEVYEI
jgi:fructose-1,6-bisphosphatase I